MPRFVDHRDLARLLLGAGLAAHVLAVVVTWRAGFWFDEYFTLWATDPSLDFGTLFRTRIAPDSNLPTYYLLIAGLRRAGLPDGVLGLVVAEASYAAAVLVVWWRGRRAGLEVAAAAAIAGFLAAGPVIANAAELRVFGPTLAAVFALGWIGLESLAPERPAPSAWLAGALGALAAGLHLFGGLAAGGLALGMLAADVRTPRRWPAALAMGGAATAVSLAFVLANWSSGRFVAWIRFDVASVATAYFSATIVAFGFGLAVLPLVRLSGLVRDDAATARIARAAGVAFAAFVLLPILASFVRPIIVPRYLVIGGPLLWLLPAFGLAIGATEPVRRWSMVTLAALLIGGPAAAALDLGRRPVWEGGALVGALGRGCPAGSIAVLGARVAEQNAAMIHGYALASGLPEATFTVGPVPPDRSCPVAGWAEHINPALAGIPYDEMVRVGFPGRVGAGERPVVVWRRDGYVAVRGAAVPGTVGQGALGL